VITKKLKTSAVALNAASSEITTECKEKFSDSCKLCTKSYCIQCELSNCEIGKYTENKTCSCKDCPTLFPDCLECDNTKCTKCKQTHYVKDGKCEICPAGKICDGIDAHDASYCTNPPDGYYCDGNTPKRCNLKYSIYCSKCDSTKCKACDGEYYLKDGICKQCLDGCSSCTNGSTCDRCNMGRILDSNKRCTIYCSGKIDHCYQCTSATNCINCQGGYYLKSPLECAACSSAISNCSRCEDSSVCTICEPGYYVNSSNKCSKCSIPNCAVCSGSGSCDSCKPGYHPSSDKKSCVENNNKFECSDLNFIKVGNLCVTRKNMGDSAMLPIPSTVNIANANSDYCYAQSSKCCWKGTIGEYCDNENGGYSGCTRTVCNWDAAKEICDKFNYGGKRWRLPNRAEMKDWGVYSISLKENGLMLCDYSPGYNSAKCASDTRCQGSHGDYCRAWKVWAESRNESVSNSATVGAGIFANTDASPKACAVSVRCVTEME